MALAPKRMREQARKISRRINKYALEEKVTIPMTCGKKSNLGLQAS